MSPHARLRSSLWDIQAFIYSLDINITYIIAAPPPRNWQALSIEASERLRSSGGEFVVSCFTKAASPKARVR
jgi:hypothetical protein